LEFLGDAVLSLLVGEHLLDTLPDAPEGVLTEHRAALVNRVALASLFGRAGIASFIHVARGYELSTKDKCDVLEAIFGAIFRSNGYGDCAVLWHSLERFLSPATSSRNAKNVLQEYCQSQGWPLPLYKITGQTGPSHAPVFSVLVEVNAPHHIFVQGSTGPTRKDAEMAAARALCQKLAIS
jgi:ribonuclease-3